MHEPERHVAQVAGAPATADPDVSPPEAVRRPITRDLMRLLRTEQQESTPSVVHNVGWAVGFKSPVTLERLDELISGLSARHAALRTAVVYDSEQGQRLEIQPVVPRARWSAVDADVDIAQRLRDLMEVPFDLGNAPLWRFELLEFPSGEQVLVYGAHHAVCDFQSLLLVAAELSVELSGERLDTTMTNRDIDLLPRAQPPALDAGARWDDEFNGCQRLDLTLASPRPSKRTFRADTVFVGVPEKVSEQMLTRAREVGVTPSALCLGVLTVFLARLRKRNRFVLAVPVDTRMHARTMDAIGFYGIPVPVASQAEPDEPIAEVLQRTNTQLKRVLKKGTSLFDAVPALVAEGLYREEAPLVELYFNYIRSHGKLTDGLEFVQASTGYSDLDMMITMMPDQGVLRLDYNVDIMDGPSCTRFGEEYLQVLADVFDDPHALTSSISVETSTVDAPDTSGSVALAATFALGDLPALLGGAFEAGEFESGAFEAGVWEASASRGSAGSATLAVTEAPYHQVLASLRDPEGPFADTSAVAGVVLLRADDLTRFGPMTDDLLAELSEEYPAALSSLHERTGLPVVVGFLPTTTADDRLLVWQRDLLSRLDDLSGVAVVGPDDWNDYPVANRVDVEADALAHLPFTPEFQAAIALRTTDLLRAIRRRAPKVIAVDGDETLWGGVAGEAGPAAVDLTGPRALLARRLVEWRAAGALLVLVSNNDEATVREVLARPESPLHAEHFSVISVGWGPKAKRIAGAVDDLNLGLDTVLFLDDNPVEIAAVRAELPEVLSVTCPAAAALPDFLARLWPVAPRPATSEDAARADFYRQERVRRDVRERTSFAEFLERLELEVDIRPLTPETVTRSAQLTRRTNQFNLRPAVFDESALRRWQNDGEVWTVEARDRFGDYGQVGVLVLRRHGDVLEVVAWMLSCRALGRGVEERLSRWLADRADELGCSTVLLIAESTERNFPARKLVAALGETEPDVDRLTVPVGPARLREFRSWVEADAEQEARGD